MTDKEKEFYVNLLTICPPQFVVFPKIKLAELIKPSAEFGTESFITTFKELNKIIIDFALFNLNENLTVALFDFQEDGEFNAQRRKFLEEVSNSIEIKYYCLSQISELYLIDIFEGNQNV